MKNELVYIKLESYADKRILDLLDYIPPKYSKPTQILNVDKVIAEVKTIHADDFHNAMMLYHIFEILLWQVALDMIPRKKLTEFIDAVSENPQAEPLATFIINAFMV